METLFTHLNIVQIRKGSAISMKLGHVHPLKMRKAQRSSQETYAKMLMEKFSTRVKKRLKRLIKYSIAECTGVCSPQRISNKINNGLKNATKSK